MLGVRTFKQITDAKCIWARQILDLGRQRHFEKDIKGVETIGQGAMVISMRKDRQISRGCSAVPLITRCPGTAMPGPLVCGNGAAGSCPAQNWADQCRYRGGATDDAAFSNDHRLCREAGLMPMRLENPQAVVEIFGQSLSLAMADEDRARAEQAMNEL